jgi:hypothetical protein
MDEIAAVSEYGLAPKDPSCVNMLHVSDLHFRSEADVSTNAALWI